jgi:hypothetical protein
MSPTYRNRSVVRVPEIDSVPTSDTAEASRGDTNGLRRTSADRHSWILRCRPPDLWVAVPRLSQTIEEALVGAISRREGAVPWDAVSLVLGTSVGVRREASVIVAHTGAVQAVMPRLRDEAVRARVGHRLRDLAASVDAERLAARR